MKIIKSALDTGEADPEGTGTAIKSILQMTADQNSTLHVGVASFENGVRQPADGLAPHEVNELSVILEGEIDLETEEGVFRVKAGDFVLIPAGEAHATTSIGDSKAYFALFG